MHILLTNDDGIFAPGLRALIEAFSGAGHTVYVCAPDRERSAASHSSMLAYPLHAMPIDMPGAARAWALDGTPADCACLGLFLCREAGIDLAVSGINRGMNQGGACVYSGTVGAAMEASMRGAPALAVSLCVGPIRGEDHSDYTTAARVALRVADWMTGHPLPRGAIYNLNVPPIPYERLRGIRPATLAPIFLEAPSYELMEDDQGPCYRFRGAMPPPQADPAYDTCRTDQGYASLTKLTWNLRLNEDDSELGGIGL
ncbi:MAG: 5'/3'-nucleotidase SurE [Clostridia bacterium]|nr:5'/3'-nucleotidase SurE [Clostridia bacterium]